MYVGGDKSPYTEEVLFCGLEQAMYVLYVYEVNFRYSKLFFDPDMF